MAILVESEFGTFDDHASSGPATAIQRQVNTDISASEQNYSGARLRYGSPCGFKAAGQKVFLVNGRNESSVRARVRVSWFGKNCSGRLEKEFLVPAGEELQIGCTLSNNLPLKIYQYVILTSEII